MLEIAGISRHSNNKRRLAEDKAGATATLYGLIAPLVAVVVNGVLTLPGQSLPTVLGASPPTYDRRCLRSGAIFRDRRVTRDRGNFEFLLV